MRLSPTLSIYIGRNFLANFIALFTTFLLLVLLLDTVELLRRASGRADAPFEQIVEMAFLKLPFMGQEIFPFAVLFGGMVTFWRLARHQELVITRAAGVSAWQFLLPVIVIAFLLGVLQTTALNPLASALLTRYEQQEAEMLKGERSLLALSGTGIWLRQSNGTDHSVIHAARILSAGNNVELNGVTVFVYEGADHFVERIDADYARLDDGFWNIRNARIQRPEEAPQSVRTLWMETDLTRDSIQDSFAPPETMSFWSLFGFIEKLEESGFSALRHRLYLHTLLAAPFLMAAMVLIAATFTLRHTRRGGTTYTVAGGVLTGFVLYFFSDVVFALGSSDSIPVTLAAWTPSGVATLLGLTTLLHLEDG